MAEEMTGKNFIEQIIEKDIAEGKVPKIVSSFYFFVRIYAALSGFIFLQEKSAPLRCFFL